MTGPETLAPSARLVALDVSGAPPRDRDAMTVIWRFGKALFLWVVLFFPVGFLDLQFHVDLFEMGGGYAIAANAYMLITLAVAFLWVFGRRAHYQRRAEKSIRLAPYGISYAEARSSVQRVLHKPLLRHPNFWALANAILAVLVPYVLGMNEAAIERLVLSDDGTSYLSNNAVELTALLVGILCVLNALRLYKRIPSLVRFSIPAVVWFVGIPLLIFVWYASSWTVAMYLWGHPEDAWASWTPGKLREFRYRADDVAFVFLYVPIGVVAILGAAVPPFRRRISRTFAAYRRAMEAVQLPSAQRALRHDRRAPVIYLRSFGVDDGLIPSGFVTSNKTSYEQRLEEAIASPLQEIGPFVAIGKPGELAVAGAARAYLADDKWKEAVVALMDKARLIVVVAGRTQGLQWELWTMRARGHLDKTIWVLPSDPKDRNALSALVRQTFLDTPYARVARAEDLQDALLVHPLEGDELAVISSTEKTGGEYEAAVQTALYGMTRHQVDLTCCRRVTQSSLV